MTPKERAEAITRKYYKFGINKEGQSLSWYESKQCALLAVEEVLNISYFTYEPTEDDELYKNHWEQVKAEIENL